MNNASAYVLLAGDTPARSTIVRKWLKKTRCSFRVAASYDEACAQLAQSEFDLVLCKYELPDRTAFPLLDWLEGSASSLVFCAKSGRESRWLPMIEHGERCLGRLLLRAANLPGTLDQLSNGRVRRRSMGSGIPAEELDHVGIE